MTTDLRSTTGRQNRRCYNGRQRGRGVDLRHARGIRVQLANKVALITGAGSGIGAGTARVFAREGAKVAVLDVRPAAAEQVAAEIRESGGIAEAFTANVADEEQVRLAVERTVER